MTLPKRRDKRTVTKSVRTKNQRKDIEKVHISCLIKSASESLKREVQDSSNYAVKVTFWSIENKDGLSQNNYHQRKTVRSNRQWPRHNEPFKVLSCQMRRIYYETSLPTNLKYHPNWNRGELRKTESWFEQQELETSQESAEGSSVILCVCVYKRARHGWLFFLQQVCIGRGGSLCGAGQSQSAKNEYTRSLCTVWWAVFVSWSYSAKRHSWSWILV